MLLIPWLVFLSALKVIPFLLHYQYAFVSTFLTPNCHVAKLSEESKKHDMMNSLDEKPPYGLTLGIKDILFAKRIVLLISGTGKSTAISMLMLEKIMSQYPVTFLWLHNNVDCLIVEWLLIKMLTWIKFEVVLTQ